MPFHVVKYGKQFFLLTPQEQCREGIDKQRAQGETVYHPAYY